MSYHNYTANVYMGSPASFSQPTYFAPPVNYGYHSATQAISMPSSGSYPVMPYSVQSYVQPYPGQQQYTYAQQPQYTAPSPYMYTGARPLLRLSVTPPPCSKCCVCCPCTAECCIRPPLAIA